MIVISKALQPIIMLHPKLNSVDILPKVITTLDDSFADLPVFKRYIKSGIFEANGDKRDKQDDVKETSEKLANSDLPQNVQDDLRKYNIVFNENSDKEFLLSQLKEKKKLYDEGVAYIKERGEKIHHKSNLETVLKKVKELEDQN